MDDEHITLRVVVNGRSVRRTVPARLTLADFLRDDLGLTGTHLGCEQGVCGACTVLLDGSSARSCLILAAQVDESRIETIEGLEGTSPCSVLQEKFSECHALQCGFCTPGFLVAAVELLEGQRRLSATKVREALSGNICRCTGYQGIVEAVLASSRDVEQKEVNPRD